MPVVSCDSQGNRMVTEARHMCNVTEQYRYFTTARSKRKEEATVPSDQVSFTACCTHASISFTVINHTGR